MSLDCNAYTRITNDVYGNDCENELASFTFNHTLNYYWELCNLIKNNADKIYTEKKDNFVFDTYKYSREKIKYLKTKDDEVHYGDDFTAFLIQLLESNYDVFYIMMF